MPPINHDALQVLCDLGTDILKMEIGEVKTFPFKDEPITIKRLE